MATWGSAQRLRCTPSGYRVTNTRNYVQRCWTGTQCQDRSSELARGIPQATREGATRRPAAHRGRLTLRPRCDDGGEFYEFNGTGTLEPVLSGVLLPHNLAW